MTNILETKHLLFVIALGIFGNVRVAPVAQIFFIDRAGNPGVVVHAPICFFAMRSSI
jgi:hypothetical protein